MRAGAPCACSSSGALILCGAPDTTGHYCGAQPRVRCEHAVKACQMHENQRGQLDAIASLHYV
jgi:hypothetical protein